MAIGSYEILDVAGKARANLEVGLPLLAVLVEGEDVVDVVDEGGNRDRGEGRRRREVFEVLLNEEVSVV
jgi:hypothetical protein